MQLKFDPNVVYECVQCGRGCFNSWDIHVEPPVVESLQGHPLQLRVIQERGQAFVPDGNGYRIHKDEQNPRCGFLQSDLLCSIHAEMGYAAKPLTCQQYPFLLVQTPDDRIYVSASYSCTSVREDIGPALWESEANIRELLARGARVHRLDAARIEVLPPFITSWPEFAEYEDELNARAQAAPNLGVLLEQALSGLARALSELQAGEQDTPIPYGLLRRSWKMADEVPGEALERLSLIRMILTMGLLKPCLFTQDREVWKAIDSAMLDGGDLVLPDFNWNAPLADLELWVNGGVGYKFDADILRFQKSLLFRKVLLTMGGLLPGLLLIWVKPQILRLLTGLHAWKEEREPCLDDFRWAVDRVETRLVGHTFDTVQVYQRAAWQCLAVCGS